MKLPDELLLSWPAVWRYPRLLSTISGHVTTGRAQELARGLIRDLARPGSPRQLFASLLDAGDFADAERMLTVPEFAAAAGDSDYREAELRLEAARLEAAIAVRERHAMLHNRAERVQVPCEELEDLLMESHLSASEAQTLMDLREAEITKKEGLLTDRHLQRLADRLRELVAGSPTADLWASSVTACIHALEFDAAEALITSGPGTGHPDLPEGFARPEAWPFPDSLGIQLRWFDGQPGPPGFLQRWAPAGGNAEAERLLNSLRTMVSGKALEAENVEELAAALDAWLGDSRADRPRAVPCADGFETRLFALCDHRLPCLGALAATGIPLRVVHRPPRDAWEPEATFRLEIPLKEHVSVAFRLSAVFEALRMDNGRTIHLLRDLGRQIPLPLILATGLPDIVTSGGPEERRRWLRWLLDLSGTTVGSPGVVETILYYAGHHSGLLQLLLQLLFTELKDRSALTPGQVRSAWVRSQNQARMCDLLLEPVRANSRLKDVLEAVVYGTSSQPRAWLTEDDLLLPDNSATGAELLQDIQRLAEDHLLEVTPDGRSFRLPNAGYRELLTQDIQSGYTTP